MDITVSDEVSQEYHALVKNILCNREFLKLSLYTHHQWTTRLMHSINVSYLSWFIARKLGCDEKAAARQDFSTISVPMTSGRRHRPVSIRRFITRRLPQTTVPHTLMSQTESWMRYSHICSLWDLFHATGKPGSSALPIKPAPSRKAAISPLHWPGGTGSSSIRHNFHTKNRAVATSDAPCFCVEIYFMVILCRLLSIS